MEGGIAILLLMVIVVVAAVIGIAMYLTGGALWFSRTSKDSDNIGGSGRGGRFRRPKHKTVSSETIENTHVVGTRDDD